MIPAQAALIDDTERLKQMILQRDAQLSAYMSQLSSQLQVVGASRLATAASHAWASGSSPTGDSLAVVSKSYAMLHSISEVRTLGLFLRTLTWGTNSSSKGIILFELLKK